MEISLKKKMFNSHQKSASTTNMFSSPHSTTTPVTCRSKADRIQHTLPSFNQKEMRRFLEKEQKEYISRKKIIESGYLTERGMTKFLKPHRLKWEKNNLKNHDTLLKTKLHIADIILNSKGGYSRRDIVIEKIQNQIESPRQITSQRTIKSEHNVQQFMDRLKFHSIPPKMRQELQSPLKTVQSQKFIFNSQTTYQTE